jgi:hypothetical protein
MSPINRVFSEDCKRDLKTEEAMSKDLRMWPLVADSNTWLRTFKKRRPLSYNFSKLNYANNLKEIQSRFFSRTSR